MVGMFGVITCNNLAKKLISLSIAQTGVILLYIASGYRPDSFSPIYKSNVTLYADPLPQVLMLTAIVVGISVMAVGLAILMKIKEHFGTIHEDELP